MNVRKIAIVGSYILIYFNDIDFIKINLETELSKELLIYHTYDNFQVKTIVLMENNIYLYNREGTEWSFKL
jgi:hypothetical protein